MRRCFHVMLCLAILVELMNFDGQTDRYRETHGNSIYRASIVSRGNSIATRMRANAQRDGRPAERRWRPLFNSAKFGLRDGTEPLLEATSCRDVVQ